METVEIIWGVALLILAGANIWQAIKIRDLEWDIDAALNAAARAARVARDTKKAFDEVKDRFDGVIAEAERQNEREAKWNTGLTNILNYSLADSFKAGGDVK